MEDTTARNNWRSSWSYSCWRSWNTSHVSPAPGISMPRGDSLSPGLSHPHPGSILYFTFVLQSREFVFTKFWKYLHRIQKKWTCRTPLLFVRTSQITSHDLNSAPRMPWGKTDYVTVRICIRGYNECLLRDNLEATYIDTWVYVQLQPALSLSR